MGLASGVLDGLIQQLETSPMVQKAMAEFLSVKNILVATVNRFDQRFGEAEERLKNLHASVEGVDIKAERIIFLLEHPSDIRPAGNDGLMKMLEDAGQQMLITEKFEPMPAQHESEPITYYNEHISHGSSVTVTGSKEIRPIL